MNALRAVTKVIPGAPGHRITFREAGLRVLHRTYRHSFFLSEIGMRRKNRKWVAIGVGLYLFVVWSAFRWGSGLRDEGNIFLKIEHEGIRRQQQERAKEVKAQGLPPAPTGESRLNAAGPAYVAARYDETHVAFIVATDTESRFNSSPWMRSGVNPVRFPASSKAYAPLAGLQELWEPDAQSLHFFPKMIQQTPTGAQWSLSILPGWIVPATIERVVVAPSGCSLALGFLAKVPSAYEGAFNGNRQEYFVIRPHSVELAQPPLSGRVGEIPASRMPSFHRDVLEQALDNQMKNELQRIDAKLRANAANPGSKESQSQFGARMRTTEWFHADDGLMRGKGVLDYDVRAFGLTPDREPRLFVRARWMLTGVPVFLMTAWFHVWPQISTLGLIWADASWSEALRSGEAAPSLGENLEFESILNEFDDDYDGWGELLIHAYDVGPQTAKDGTASIGLYLYTDKGLVPLKDPLRRSLEKPEACLEQ